MPDQAHPPISETTNKMTSSLAPQSESEFEVLPEEAPFPIQCFDPYFADAVLDKVTKGMEKVDSPEIPEDIFPFLFHFRKLLSASVTTSWLLDPVHHSRPRQRAISMKCASFIGTLVPNELVVDDTWPDYTNEVVALLERITPTPFLSTVDKETVFPTFRDGEYGCDYLARAELWVAYHCPGVDSSPVMIQYFAAKLWASYRANYNMANLFDSFEKAISKFDNFAAALKWFANALDSRDERRGEVTWSKPKA